MYRHKLIFLPLLCFTALTVTAEVTVETYFQPKHIPTGYNAEYVIKIEEQVPRNQAEPEDIKHIANLPEVEGLEYLEARKSIVNQSHSTNGIQQYSVIQYIRIDTKPSKEGTYTVPDYSIKYKHKNLTIPPTSLVVSGTVPISHPKDDRLIFLEIDSPEHLHLGSPIDIKLNLYVYEQTRILNFTGFKWEADAFLVTTHDDQASKNSETLNEHNYQVLSWPITITPIQNGQHSLDFEIKLSAILHSDESLNSENMNDSPFKHSFSNRRSIAASARKDVVTSSPIDQKGINWTDINQSKITDSKIKKIIAVDISSSMHALDFSSKEIVTTRLNAAKLIISRHLKKHNISNIGLVAFAENATYLPSSKFQNDHFLEELDNLRTSKITRNNTNIGKAIALSLLKLKNDSKNRSISLITDGHNTTGELSLATAASAAKALGVKIDVIAIGTTGTVSMPELDEDGSIRSEENGSAGKFWRINSTQNYEELQLATERTGGHFHHLASYSQLQELFNTCENQNNPANSSANKSKNHKREWDKTNKLSTKSSELESTDMTLKEAENLLQLLH